MNDEITDKSKISLANFYNKNKILIISTLIIIILSIIILIIIDGYKEKNNIKVSEQFNKAKILIENNNQQQGLEILEKIIFKNNKFYSPSALNLIIDKNLIKDKTKILYYFDLIIKNKKLDPEIKNLFIFKKIIYIGEDIEENKLLNTLSPIIQSNSLWKNSALDFIKKYYLSKGEFNKAKEFETKMN